MRDDRPKVVVITGPTASGKSSLAIELARYLGGEIVNADSMQVYRGMDVGTAKPTTMERRGVPHHLLDVVDPDENFDAALYRSLAIPLLMDIASREKICFVVGGTGLYIKSLLSGLLKCPSTDPALRKKMLLEWEGDGPISLHERLKRLDPESARKIHPNDKVRVIRALEVIHLTNKPFSSLIQQHDFKDRPFQALKIYLQMDRERLYFKINQRSLAMIEAGLVHETEHLLGKGYSPDLKSMKSLGYRHMVKFLDGSCGLDEAILQLQVDTRRYAKRQLTWFKADPEIIWMKPEDWDGIFKKIEEFNGDTP
ncbi:MAG: tRNA (adenosine(37)-N6)-dimethylallyltransferase MiaA [Desulfatiglandales bacterium]|jgi:tRNA dimethylallyltransferase|nr:tRNA (adenosine(37)-N6)-dimethylallyltransferase MiaA [Desulfatiglandales bacterium]